MKTIKMTLCELSNELINLGYPDLFDYAVDGDILDLNSMVGSVADTDGDNVVEFKIVKLNNTDTFLDTIIEIDTDYLK